MDAQSESFDFDVTGLPEAWWRETAAEVHASEQQLKFAAAYSQREVSAVEAARRAGIGGNGNSLRQAAHRLSRSVAVEELLGRAKLERSATEDLKDGTVDALEARRILSRLARNADPNIKVRAIESLLRLDEADRLRLEQQTERSPEEILADLRAIAPSVADAMEYPVGTPEDRKATLRKLIQENPSSALWYIRELSPAVFGNGVEREAS
jgi:hypothetical protein